MTGPLQMMIKVAAADADPSAAAATTPTVAAVAAATTAEQYQKRFVGDPAGGCWVACAAA